MFWVITGLVGAMLIAVGCAARFSSKREQVDKREEEILIASLPTIWMGS